MNGTLLQNGQQQFLDSNGNPLSGGSVGTFYPGTSTLLTTYQDPALTIANANPVILDSSGMCTMWVPFNQLVQQVVMNSFGVVIWNTVSGILMDGLTLNALNVGVDSGAANAYVLTLDPPLSALEVGTTITFIPANANTAASTVNVDGFGNKNLLGQAGLALSGGEVATGPTVIVYNGTAFDLVFSAGGIPQIRTVGPLNVATDSGTANAYVLTTTPALPSLSSTVWVGTKLTFLPLNSNTGASTVNSAAIVGPAGALQGGEIVATKPTTVTWTGTEWFLEPGSGATQTPPAIASNQAVILGQALMAGASAYTASSKDYGVQYTNTSGHPLCVVIGFTCQTAGGLAFNIGSLSYGNLTAVVNGNLQYELFFIIPVGCTYELVVFSGAITIALWWEA